MFSYVSSKQSWVLSPGEHPGLSLPTHQGLADRPERMVLVEHDLHNTELGLHLRLFGLASSGGSDKNEGEKWTASEAGKTKALASWQLWRHCRCPWVFFQKRDHQKRARRGH